MNEIRLRNLTASDLKIVEALKAEFSQKTVNKAVLSALRKYSTQGKYLKQLEFEYKILRERMNQANDLAHSMKRFFDDLLKTGKSS